MRTSYKLLAMAAVLGIFLAGCGRQNADTSSGSADQFTKVLAAQSQLKKFASPEEAKEFFEKRSASAPSAMPLSATARDSAVKESAPAAQNGGLGAGAGTGIPSFSGTNVQVTGVDEADIIKTDGQYIYAVTDRNLVIVKAGPATSMEIVSTTVLDSRPQEVYVKGDKLVVFGYDETTQFQGDKMAAPLIIRPGSSYTFLAVYDIADRTAPKQLRRLSLEGGYTSSRLIGDRLYFITANYNYYPLDDVVLPRILENGKVISDSQTTPAYVYPDMYYIDTPSSVDQTSVTVLNLEDIAAPVRSQVYFMPSGQTVYASANALYLAYTKYISEYDLRMAVARELLAPRLSERDRQRIDSINAIDSAILSDDEKLAKVNQIIQTFLSRLSPDEQKTLNGEVEEEFNRRHPDLANELEKTVVHKIAFDGDGLRYEASAEVTGHLLNQYSLDEYEGHLRIATTRGQSWIRPLIFSANAMFAPSPDEPSINNVYVLDGKLQPAGALENLASGERIYAVRFMGSRAYLVTFKQTDPLFVIDLGNPAQPVVLGELKLPGFSNYLHPYDDTTLIGIGRQAVDKGDQGVDLLGLKVSLFDVKDPAAPREISSITLGGRGSDTTAAYDHKAVLFDKGKNLLAIPATLTAAGTTDYKTEFQGSLVFTVTSDKISERGRVSFRLPTEMSSKQVYIDDMVRRNLYINDTLYSYSPANLKASRLSDVSAVRALAMPAPVPAQGVTPPALPYAATDAVR